MHDEFIDGLDKTLRTNGELVSRLRHSESRNAGLQLEVQLMKTRLALLVGKLDIANNEIERLSMVLKHQAKVREPVKHMKGLNLELFPPDPSP